MLIASLHNGHDASVTFLENEKIIHHFEAERTIGVKHFAGQHNFNVISEFFLDYTLPKVGSLKDVDAICLSCLYAGWWGKMWKDTEFDVIIGDKTYEENNLNQPFVKWNANWRGKKFDFFASLHHMNHMAYGYYTSPFDESLIFAYDGQGDFRTTSTFAQARGNQIEYLGDLKTKPYGLKNNYIGFAYSKLHFLFPFLGNNDLATPGKAMGLASYGKVDEKWKDIIRYYITDDSPIDGKLNKLKESVVLPNDPRCPDVQNFLTTFQDECANLIVHTIDTLLKKTFNKNLVISGGCGLNVLINSKLAKLANIYIPPACSDSGQSIGCALYYWHHVLNNPFAPVRWHTPYLGDVISNNKYTLNRNKEMRSTTIVQENTYVINKNKILCEDIEESLTKKVAKLITSGKIIAWAQGKAEIGPRALGNRSIFCLPYPENMKDILNFKVKHREWWRPFAPICLQEYAKDWFETNREHKYMLEAVKVKEEKKNLIPAITHIDGTARLQTITKEQNPLLHSLLLEIYKLNGIPILLNTSLNDKGKPIANNLQDIIELLEGTELDYAVVNNNIFKKRRLFI